MLFLRKPSLDAIHSLLAERRGASYSYPDIGATRGVPPAGWHVNDAELIVGTGRALYDHLEKALFSWELLAVGGLQVFAAATPLLPGTDVAILSRHFGIWSLDFCRVLSVLHDEPEKDGAVLRTGFVYGTLPGHALCGEEMFSVTWSPATEEVRYAVFSFSKPSGLLVALLAPVARSTQRRFVRASLEKAVGLAKT